MGALPKMTKVPVYYVRQGVDGNTQTWCLTDECVTSVCVFKWFETWMSFSRADNEPGGYAVVVLMEPTCYSLILRFPPHRHTTNMSAVSCCNTLVPRTSSLGARRMARIHQIDHFYLCRPSNLAFFFFCSAGHQVILDIGATSPLTCNHFLE